jgi:hypothetical protein
VKTGCLLSALGRHLYLRRKCPLSRVKRTSECSRLVQSGKPGRFSPGQRCLLRFIGIPPRRPCAASLQGCQRSSFVARARSRTYSRGARPPRTPLPCHSWLVLLPSRGQRAKPFHAPFSSKAKRGQGNDVFTTSSCALSGAKRTPPRLGMLSAYDPKRARDVSSTLNNAV